MSAKDDWRRKTRAAEEGLAVILSWYGESGQITVQCMAELAAEVADRLIDQDAIDSRVDAALSDARIVSAAILRLSPEDRDAIRVLLDALATRGL